MRRIKTFTQEPISITYEFANEQIQKANDHLQELNDLITIKNKRDSFYYNCLDNEEEN